MSLLGALLSLCFTGVVCNQPLDYGMVSTTNQIEQPILEGVASRYDYQINGNWRTKTHDVCALRIYERYHHYKVCLKGTDKCIVCKQTDYGPKEHTNKVIDLSSHAFKQLAPLSKGVIEVQIYKLD